MQSIPLPVRQVLALVVLALALVAGASTLGTGQTDTVAATTSTCVDPGKGLFNACALLDTSRVDDLRDDADSRCLAAQGLLLTTGECVDGFFLYEDETDAETWTHLVDTGFDHGLDCDDVDCLWIPAEYVVLGGESGEDVLAVDTTRPLTPRS